MAQALPWEKVDSGGDTSIRYSLFGQSRTRRSKLLVPPTDSSQKPVEPERPANPKKTEFRFVEI